FPQHIYIADLCDGNNHMRHAAVNKMNDSLFRADVKRNIESQIGRFGHLQSDEISSQLRRNDASYRLKGDLAPGARHLVCKPRKATRAVSAHLRFSAVGIEIAHSKIRVVRWIFQQHNAISSDTAMAITEARDLATI